MFLSLTGILVVVLLAQAFKGLRDNHFDALRMAELVKDTAGNTEPSGLPPDGQTRQRMHAASLTRAIHKGGHRSATIPISSGRRRDVTLWFFQLD
jgi:hypothetical protein